MGSCSMSEIVLTINPLLGIQRGLKTCASAFPGGLSSSISIAVRGVALRTRDNKAKLKQSGITPNILGCHGSVATHMTKNDSVRDAGNLLTREGFTLPGVDVDEYTVQYSSALELIEHLRAMGETSALLQRSKVLKKDTALATADIYESMFAAEDGTIPATF
ncbi:putative methyltransferase [Capsicum baccatum]|uniref:Methyltransferase n=1 Tax=Capsicum baccatum TaxID=33114 RepID=A0A2G2VSB5_CAPBA|nr:putative methyltransferase [Capsicum baccatum]